MSPRETGRRFRACAALGLMAFLVAAAPAGAASLGSRILKIGSKGPDVRAAQKALNTIGLKTRIDGVYGPGTAARVKRFERTEGRKADGKLAPADAKALQQAASQGGTGTMDDPSSGDAANGSGGTTYEAAQGNPSQRATLSQDGRTAIAPDAAPPEVKAAIDAANRITSKPYKYGGGHGQWEDSGYDCSGTVSYALHGGNLLDKPMDSSELESFGEAGKGQWITIFANSGHTFVLIAGLRLDTSGSGEDGPRWRTESRSTSGYVVRHPAGF